MQQSRCSVTIELSHVAVRPCNALSALGSAGRATPQCQQPAASLQQADVGAPNPAAALPAVAAPQHVPAPGPLGLKSPFAAVQQALAASAATGKDSPPDEVASHTTLPQGFHETGPCRLAPAMAGLHSGCRLHSSTRPATAVK